MKVVDKITTHILCSVTPPENRAVYEIMWKKYGRAAEATDDNMKRCMRLACWICKATDTHLEYVILIAFPHDNNGYAAALHCYVITHCLPVGSRVPDLKPAIWYPLTKVRILSI